MAATEADLIPTHVTSVVGTRVLSESYVRITFGGGLDRYRSSGPDDFVYVLLPPPGRAELTIDETFRWTDYEAMAEAARPVGAYYTVRHRRPEVGEIDCDVYLHDPAGWVSAWATRAEPGNPAALWGPRTAWAPPATTTEWLLVADETGIPALAAILEQRPSGLHARAFIEVGRGITRPELPSSDDVTITWLERGGRAAGTTDLLLEAVRVAAPPSPTTYVWGGAESRAMAAIRRHVRRELGLARENVSLTPYWRHADHVEDLVDDDD
jgi:NADPH-dependent ferric siderophore reductase